MNAEPLDDAEDLLSDLCADLVSLRRHEAFPRYLLTERKSRTWLRVGRTCARLGVEIGEVSPSLFAKWLPPPSGNADYAVILFYDEDSGWSTTALYNRERLLAESPRTTAAAVTAPSPAD
jgi:hypothetical protein